MVRRRDDFEDPSNPDELDDDEQGALRSPLYQNASDAEICRGADAGDPVANEIFYSWSPERRRAAERAVDAEHQAQY